jgi:hypothetical protein
MLVTRLYNHEKLIQNINFEILKQTHFIITKKNMKNENPIIAIVHKPNLNTLEFFSSPPPTPFSPPPPRFSIFAFGPRQTKVRNLDPELFLL